MVPERNNPLISIVLPVYNTADYLEACLESVLAQTYAHFECIVIDDASHDRSVVIIEQYARKDPRIRLLQNETNQGIGYTRNRGLEVASGTYIANFDSDDIAFPEWLETQLQYLETHPDTDIVGANFVFIDRLGNRLLEKNNFPEHDRDIKKVIPLVCPIANNTVLIRKKCFDEMGAYRPSAHVAEDYDLWMRFRERYVFHNTQKSLVYYRVHGQNSIIRERDRIIRETMADFRNKVRYLYPPSFVLIRFIFLSFVSYGIVFIRLKFR
ncbi:MAG: glycosyltransferase [Candidatus Gracilibacteria bacterium]|nr:glycosyltransferase [Candidatus Gracilibacteria bacterium]